MMENISLTSNNQLSVNDITRIGDLINFEGPLMSLYKNINNSKLYIFEWIDYNNIANRWLVYEVSVFSLNDFLNNKIHHLNLFESISGRQLYIVDIEDGKFLQDSFINEVNNIPEKYFPDKNFFDEEDCSSLTSIKEAIATIHSTTTDTFLKRFSTYSNTINLMKPEYRYDQLGDIDITFHQSVPVTCIYTYTTSKVGFITHSERGDSEDLTLKKLKENSIDDIDKKNYIF